MAELMDVHASTSTYKSLQLAGSQILGKMGLSTTNVLPVLAIGRYHPTECRLDATLLALQQLSWIEEQYCRLVAYRHPRII
jgi:hypothetical protein